MTRIASSILLGLGLLAAVNLPAHGQQSVTHVIVAPPAAAAMAASGAASVQSNPARKPTPLHRDGSTRSWLQAQASGEQASAARPALSGPVLRKVHERYVNSFGTPIPERVGDSRRP